MTDLERAVAELQAMGTTRLVDVRVYDGTNHTITRCVSKILPTQVDGIKQITYELTIRVTPHA